MAKFAYTTYKKILVDLRSCLRGNELNHTTSINDIKIIIDLCPLTDKLEKPCNKNSLQSKLY